MKTETTLKLENLMNEIFSQSTIKRMIYDEDSNYSILCKMDMYLGGEDCLEETDEFEHIQSYFHLTFDEINKLI